MGSLQECFLCKDENAQFSSDFETDFIYMNCPICGKYVLPPRSRYIKNRALGLDISDNIRARDFLFYHKSDSYTLIGTEEECKDFRLTYPRKVIRWITKQQIDNWYPHSLSQILNLAVTYFNNYQTPFGQKMIFN